MTDVPELSTSTKWGSVAAVWGFAVLCAVVVSVLPPHRLRLDLLSLSLAASVFAAMCAQLATQQKKGFVSRLAASMAGAVIVLGIAAIVLEA